MCDRLALFMSDPQDRDRLLKSKETFLQIAAEGDVRPVPMMDGNRTAALEQARGHLPGAPAMGAGRRSQA